MPLLPDLRPLREYPAYRRLFTGNVLAAIGSQLAVVAIGIQVYDLTGSSAMVGLVGAFAFVPLVVMGLYGGSLADRYDRRWVALISQIVGWLTSITCAVLAFRDVEAVWPYFVIAALWSGSFAVTSPARTAIYPRILPADLLPAANALSVISMTVAMMAGPLLAGFLVDAVGYAGAYVTDAAITTAALWGIGSLPPIPPLTDAVTQVPGLRSVFDGLAFLATAPNVRMTFVADLCAMVIAQPTVFFPAAGAVILGGGARTVGLLSAAVAVGGLAAMMLSGRLGGVRFQGRAVMVCIVGWGLGVALFGLALLGTTHDLLGQRAGTALALFGLAIAGACDSVSAVFRNTILQTAAPDHMRGRLQGVFTAVVAGGPRMGALLGGAVAVAIGESWTALAGGLVCIAVIALLSVVQRGFWRYDARHPTP